MPAVVNTELGTGLKDVKGVKKSEPRTSRTRSSRRSRPGASRSACRKVSQAISTVMPLVPRRGRDAVARALGADKVLAEPDKAARAAYEERAAHSEPGLEPRRV